MAIYRYHQFENSVEYYTGQGCLVCGSNLGACIDLGVYDSIEGAIALCEDHARECGVQVGMVHPSELEQREQEAADKSAIADVILQQAEEAKERAEQTHAYIKDMLRPSDTQPPALPKKSLKKDAQ